MNSSNGLKRRVAVYCGSAPGTDPAYMAEATALGRQIAEAGLGMVYGGANIGLMGAVANAALSAGAEVMGILPEVLAGYEIAHTGLTAFEMVPTMHERKARMAELADAFLILPGGYGTFDELMEALTWAQLRLHSKPCILINTSNYWNGLLSFIDSTVTAGFVKPESRELLMVAANAAEAVAMVTQHRDH
jgi:TIGR00730 family protein